MPWQEQIIRDVFGIVDERGNRQFRTAYVEIGKKNGKSELAAAVALYLLFADNEPSAEVYGAAADRQQASIVFDVANQMVQMTPALMKRCKIMAATKRMAKHAHPDQVPDTPDEWLENFNTFSIYQILPQLIELWGLNVQTEVEARKILAKVSG